MPLLFVLVMAVLVNFPSFVQAQETTTRIRGPRSSDTPPAPETLGPLSPSDTLWRVADRIKPDGNISLYQVMYALYLKNPTAFLDNNLNHLRPGAVLVLPTLSEIQQVDLNTAKQKSEQDDKDWAARQKAAVAKSSTGKTSAKPEPQWQAELARIGQAQRQDLDSLRSQFADSMQQVVAIAEENLQLKTSLAKVEHQLTLIQAQLGEDSEIQQQISLLLKQQAELLQAKAAAEAAASEQADWQQWFKQPLAWVLAACIPALLVLFSILLWVKKRSRHTEQVINAATPASATDPTYHSPLPPLDESSDIDDSLFEIDDALLEDAFSDNVQAAEPDLIDDDDAFGFDDGLSFEDDSLLPAETVASTGLDSTDEFDPDNILSDTDLSALLAAEDDDAAIIELADDNLEPDDIELVEEDDLWPEPDQQTASTAQTETDTQHSEVDDAIADLEEFDIDELIEEIDLDEPDEPAPVAVTPLQQAAYQTSQQSAADTSDELDDAVMEPDDSLSGVKIAEDSAEEADSFDSSELEEFAESLAAEGSPPVLTEAADELNNNEEALLSAELAELLDQVDDIDVSADADVGIEQQTMSGIAGQAEPRTDEQNDALLVDAADADGDDTTLTALDLSDSDDDSVVRPTDAAMSVENPSKMLEQYPALELAEDALESDSEAELSADAWDLDADASLPEHALDTEADAELLQMPELEADLLMQDLHEAEESSVEKSQQELDPLPDTQFDSLMSELEAMADNLDVSEHQEQTEDKVPDPATTADTADAGFDFTDDDFVEIDSLLANAGQQEPDSERFNQLNVDVGLEDYADIIGEHERRDVDTEDNGYSAKLDLVRAYIEIDDLESADLLLDEILASDAPEHVKTEAQSLKR